MSNLILNRRRLSSIRATTNSNSILIENLLSTPVRVRTPSARRGFAFGAQVLLQTCPSQIPKVEVCSEYLIFQEIDITPFRFKEYSPALLRHIPLSLASPKPNRIPNIFVLRCWHQNRRSAFTLRRSRCAGWPLSI